MTVDDVSPDMIIIANIDNKIIFPGLFIALNDTCEVLHVRGPMDSEGMGLMSQKDDIRRRRCIEQSF